MRSFHLRSSGPHLTLFIQVSSSVKTQRLLVNTSPTTSANGRYQSFEYRLSHHVHSINDFNPTQEKPFVLGLPTGSSPIPTYKALIRKVKEGQLS
jgi:hypothetical protein